MKSFSLWSLPQMAFNGQGWAWLKPELYPGLPHSWQAPKHLGHFLLLCQAH